MLGVGFGFALNKAGLTGYHKIVNVFRLTDLAVLKFMMTGLVVSMIGLYGLRALGLLTFPTVPATYIAGNLLGGLIFGVGMAASGYCPGTCAAGAGEGRLDYIDPWSAGLLDRRRHLRPDLPAGLSRHCRHRQLWQRGGSPDVSTSATGC